MNFFLRCSTSTQFLKRIAGRISVMSMLLFAGCTVGPNYRRPAAEVPATYKEVGDWKAAQPNDQSVNGN